MKRKIFKIASYAIPLIVGGTLIVSGLTSCKKNASSDNYVGNPLPLTINGNNVFDISTNGQQLNGFSEWFVKNQTTYSQLYNQILIPASIKSVAAQAFSSKLPDFINIISVESGSDSLNIGDCSFAWNDSLRIVDLRNATNITVNSYNAFSNAGDGLDEVWLPKKLQSVGKYAFLSSSIKKIIWTSSDSIDQYLSKMNTGVFTDSSSHHDTILPSNGEFIVDKDISVNFEDLKNAFIAKFDKPVSAPDKPFKTWTVRSLNN